MSTRSNLASPFEMLQWLTRHQFAHPPSFNLPCTACLILDSFCLMPTRGLLILAMSRQHKLSNARPDFEAEMPIFHKNNDVIPLWHIRCQQFPEQFRNSRTEKLRASSWRQCVPSESHLDAKSSRPSICIHPADLHLRIKLNFPEGTWDLCHNSHHLYFMQSANMASQKITKISNVISQR